MKERSTIQATREPVIQLSLRDSRFHLTIGEAIALRDRLHVLLAEQHAGIIGVIREIVAQEFKMPLYKLDSEERTDAVCRARHAAFWLCRQHGFSFTQIGKSFNRDHGAVMHGCSVFADRMETSRELRRAGEHLAEMVNRALASGNAIQAATRIPYTTASPTC